MAASEIVELLAELVSIDSVNPTLIRGGAGEERIARFVAEWCDRAGLEVELVEAAPRRPSVVAVARGTGGGRSLMLNAHTDTVGVAGMDDPHQPRLEDGHLYGRAAHGSRPDLGIDAIAKMGHVLVGLDELDRSLRANPSHALLGSGSLHASIITGGQEYSSYPERCVLQAERRTLPGETVAQVE